MATNLSIFGDTVNLGVLIFVSPHQARTPLSGEQEKTHDMKFQSRIARAIVLAALVLAPVAAAAQSTLATSDATAFLGTWTMTLESPQGAFEQTLVIKDMAGKVGAELTNQMAPEPTHITDITKAGTDLVLKFAGDFQGNAFTAAITLTPDGDDKAKASFNIMDGMFVMEGAATKK
jgi:hypothetical protein